MIHYPNKPIFSTVIVRPRVALLNMQNITNQDQLNKLVNTSMTSLASKAFDVPISVKKFRTDEVNISAFQMLYNLVQCTPDLSSTDCNLCLQTAIIRLPKCCDGEQGARVLLLMSRKPVKSTHDGLFDGTKTKMLVFGSKPLICEGSSNPQSDRSRIY